ncbi:MAG: sulfatase [Prosthecobacter sp.]
MRPPAAVFSALLLLAVPPMNCDAANERRPNIVFICADDLNYDSVGCYGCPIPGLTPNVDALAAEGLLFEHAYATVAVCQPVREIMHSGLYPHRGGAMGFFPLKPHVRTLNQQLHEAGYLISLIGKGAHYKPAGSFPTDLAEEKTNRSPERLAALTRDFVARAKAEGRPFFHHVNLGDPHHPLIGQKGPDDLADGDPPSRHIKPEEITSVPGFLEDLPEVRAEMARYYTNVRRMDDCVGAVLDELDESGERENTIVMFFGGDHGMAWAFAKSNVYENSSRAGLIFRWPGVVKEGTHDTEHLVSTLDFTPTLLEACGVPMIPDLDGRSFLPVLKGGHLAGWDRVHTCYNQGGPAVWMTMRCIRTKDRAYIWNGWHDGKTVYQGGMWADKKAVTQLSPGWRATHKAAKENPALQERLNLLNLRTPEEFYDLTNDRFERHNLIADPARQVEIEAMRAELLALMRRTEDPYAEAFAQRDVRSVYLAARDKVEAEYQRKPLQKKATPATKAKAAAVQN